MIKVVLTVQDDVCVKNNKDVNATELLKIMATYGKVEKFDDCVKTIESDYQDTIDNLVAENEAIKAQNLTEEEIAIVNEYRKQRARAVQGYIEENAELRQTLGDVKAKHEQTLEIIANAISDN